MVQHASAGVNGNSPNLPGELFRDHGGEAEREQELVAELAKL